MSEKGDLISRETLGVGRCNPDVMLDPAYAAGWNALLNIINNAPAVDAAPVVHGRWEQKHSNVCCTACSKGYRITNGGSNVMTFVHCPNCGAKMEGKEG